ncbi:flagellar hook-associated protein FlgK [Thioalkalicoccus limnaeus]|uniref:Flagellar hook-associated protein 1 n=1 Tax=Thioalkalicoccus limnaeus TaxID=120681 RepID=A0ABV4BBX0_9GAMM
MGVNLIQTGLSGLNAARSGLATTSHNIANAATPGYSRQRVFQTAATPIHAGPGFVGTGTRAVDIQRSYDQFLTRELQLETAAAAQLRTHHTQAARLDALLSNSATSLTPVLQGFFDAVHQAAAEPASGAARQLLLEQMDRVTERFSLMDQRLQQTRAGVVGDIRSHVDRINTLSAEVARLNRGVAEARGSGSAPNDLLDRRDELVRQLAEHAGVTPLIQGDGTLNLFIGNGVPLVVGSETMPLAVGVSSRDPSATGLFSVGHGGTRVEVTGQVQGGALGGLIDFERGLLADAERQLGLFALGLADAANAQHRLGMDPVGRLGGDLFTNVNSPALQVARAIGQADNQGNAWLEVRIDQVGTLNGSDYRLTYDGDEGGYRLIRARDNQIVDTFADLPHSVASEGFTIRLAAGAMDAGDSFWIRPAAGAAGALRRVAADASSLALAAPVRADPVGGNIGEARIGPVTVSALSGTALTGAITLTYDAANARFAVTDPPGGTLAYSPDSDSGATLNLAVPGFGELAFTMTGAPADADRFVLAGNAQGVGDNRNALALAAQLQETPLLFGGSATLTEGYERLVTEVGGRTQGLGFAAETQEKLVRWAQDAREALSGVNLDEEAADLLRLQQAYEASARVIAVSNDLFQTLLGALRG